MTATSASKYAPEGFILKDIISILCTPFSLFHNMTLLKVYVASVA